MVVSTMKCGLFGNLPVGRRAKIQGLWSDFLGGSPTLLSSWFLLYIKLLLFFSTKQCTYTYKPFSLSYLQALRINFLTPWTKFLSWLCIEPWHGSILCRVCNGELRDYTREGYNVVFKPRLQCRWASYPWKWKLFVHETYCENISFLSAANKSKVYHGIPPEPDLGVVLKEENEEEDKDKPKVSTFWKDGVVFKLVREVCSVALVLLYCFSN